MKKIKKTKKSELERILCSFDSHEEQINNPKSDFLNKNSKETFSHQWDFVNDHFFEEKYVYYLKFPEKSERYDFKNCVNIKQTKDQIYDQV